MKRHEELAWSQHNVLSFCSFITELSSAASKKAIYQTAVEYVRSIIPSDRASINLLTNDDLNLELVGLSGERFEILLSEGQQYPLGDAITEVFVREGTSYFGDITSINNPPQRFIESDLKSMMTAPLIVSGRCIGTFNCFSKNEGFYQTESLQLLEVVVGLVASNLERLQLLAELSVSLEDYRGHADRLEKITRAAELLSRAHTETEAFDYISSTLDDILPSNFKRNLEVDFGEKSFKIFRVSASEQLEQTGVFDLNDGAFTEFLMQNQSTYFSDFKTSIYQPLRELSDKGLTCGWILPIRINGLVSKYLNIASYHTVDNGHKYLQIFDALASLLSSTIERIRAQKQMVFEANFDGLTGLPNRSCFNVELTKLAANVSEKPFALLFLDLDNFKSVNDSLGHHLGDKLLTVAALRVVNAVDETRLVVRLGGDEFVVLVIDNDIEAVAKRTAGAIVDAFKEPISIDGHKMHISTSIGISMAPKHSASPEDLVRFADMAMYQAKVNGRNGYEVYSEKLSATVLYKQKVTNALYSALDNNELTISFQPQFFKHDLIGVEALLRWNNPELGQVDPAEFIPLAEDLRIISRFTVWVLDKALVEIKAIRRVLPTMHIAINVSALDCMMSEQFISLVLDGLKKHDLPGSALELEITENVYLKDTESVASLFQTLKRHGIRIAMDDFGKGYSSLTYLTRIPFDTIKIDRSFISDIETNMSNRSLVHGIVTIADSLDIDCLAEGVETYAQMQFLAGLGCHHVQGYYMSKPLSSEQFREQYLLS